MTQQPRTWFSGDSSPEDQKQTAAIVAVVIAAIAILSPFSAIAFVAMWFLFSKVRISHKVLAAFLGLYVLLIAVTGLLPLLTNLFVQSFITEINAISGGEFSAAVYFKAVIAQIPIAILIGGIPGVVYNWWRFVRQPEWKKIQFRRTPVEVWRRKKNIDDISSDKNSPQDGMSLGIDDKTGKRINQTFAEAAAHTCIFGAAGGGKTVTMMVRARDVIKQGHGLVFIDLKGGTDVPEILHEYTERYGRKFYHFAIQHPSQPYTGPSEKGLSFYIPLGRGDASRRKDMVVSLREWSEYHYKMMASNYVQVAFDVAIAVPPDKGVDEFTDIINLMNPEILKQRARRLPQEPQYEELRHAARSLTERTMTKDAQSAVTGMRGTLQNIRNSTVGHWLRSAPEGKDNIDIRKIADEGSVVVFTLDSSTYPELSQQVANLIIQDLKTVSAELRQRPSAKPLHVDIDEFSALDSENIIGLINKSRDAKMPVTMATQALGDLRRINITFLEQLLGIVSAFIIHRANRLEDAEVYAGLTGKGTRWDVRYAVEHTSGGILGGPGKGAATGGGSVSEVEDFRVRPQEIQELQPGEMIYVAKSPKPRFQMTRVIPEAKVVRKVAEEHSDEAVTIGDKVNKQFHTATPSSTSKSTYNLDGLLGSDQDDNFDEPSFEQDDFDVDELLRKAESRKAKLQSNPIFEEDGYDEEDSAETSGSFDFPIKNSSGFLNGRDLNAALRGGKPQTKRDPETRSSQEVAVSEKKESTRASALPTERAPSVSRPLPQFNGTVPQRPKMPLPPKKSPLPRPEAPASGQKKKPSSPSAPTPSSNTARPPMPQPQSRKKIVEEWD